MMYMIPSLLALRDRVTALDPGCGRHDTARTQHKVACPAERMLAGCLRPVTTDRGERTESLVDRVLHGAHAGRDVVPDDRRLGVELREQPLDCLPLIH